MENKKKLPLPLLILIIGLVVGLLVAAFGLYKQYDAKRENKKRHDQAYSQALKNKERLEKRYAEITEELKPLKEKNEAKKQECDSISMSDPNWFENKSKCQRESSELDSQISDLESEQWEIEHYNNTVYYEKVKPMTYQIFYIIGGCIAGLAALAAFIIYLVKGKKTYD